MTATAELRKVVETHLSLHSRLPESLALRLLEKIAELEAQLAASQPTPKPFPVRVHA